MGGHFEPKNPGQFRPEKGGHFHWIFHSGCNALIFSVNLEGFEPPTS
jgi:hypothetical protein